MATKEQSDAFFLAIHGAAPDVGCHIESEDDDGTGDLVFYLESPRTMSERTDAALGDVWSVDPETGEDVSSIPADRIDAVIDALNDAADDDGLEALEEEEAARQAEADGPDDDAEEEEDAEDGIIVPVQRDRDTGELYIEFGLRVDEEEATPA